MKWSAAKTTLISTKMMELKALKLTDEELFIVLSCRKAVKLGALDSVDALLKQDLDWTYIEGMIRLHGIAGLVNNALAQNRYLHNVPDGMLKNLTLASRQAAFKNMVYLREFSTLVKACNREQLRIVPLKGIAFLTSLYEHNSTLRSLSDIDILVENKDLKSVEDILLAMGFQPKPTSTRDSRRSFHSIYRRRVSGFTMVIEVHWDIDYADSPYAIDIGECWQRSHEVINDVGTHYELSLEDNLILNCFHILRHIPKGPDVLLHLKNFCDIAAMITQWGEDLDWDCVVRRSRHYKVLRPVGLVLRLVQELLGITQVPLTIQEALHNEGFHDDFAACAVREYIFNSPESKKKALPYWMVDLTTASNAREKLAIIRELPRVFSLVYRRRYYGGRSRSALQTFVHVTWYYMQKTATTLIFYLRAPRKASQLQKNLKEVNRKTKEVIDWLQN